MANRIEPSFKGNSSLAKLAHGWRDVLRFFQGCESVLDVDSSRLEEEAEQNHPPPSFPTAFWRVGHFGEDWVSGVVEKAAGVFLDDRRRLILHLGYKWKKKHSSLEIPNNGSEKLRLVETTT